MLIIIVFNINVNTHNITIFPITIKIMDKLVLKRIVIINWK